MHVKTTRRYHHTPSRTAKSRTLTTPDAGGCGAVGTLTAGRNAHSAGTLGGSLMMSHKPYHALTTWPSNHVPWHLPKGVENVCPHRSLHQDVYCNPVHDRHNSGSTRCPSAGGGYMVVRLVGYCAALKRNELWRHEKMWRNRVHVIKWKRSIGKGYTLCNPNSMTTGKRQS